MKKLKNIKVLTTCAMLVALAVILAFLKIPVNQFIELRFDSLPIALAGYLFGPAVGGIVGGITDIAGYIVRPTGAFFPGFTVSAIVAGVIYGIVLHGKKATVLRVFIAQLLRTVVVGLLLNPLWLSILYGNSFLVIMSGRLLTEAIMLPIKTALLFAVIKPANIFNEHFDPFGTVLPHSEKSPHL
ncbi:MAG: folate family ECF transporter S component [Lachnospiraceae bacterium]|nr:folate family ECF transporter S component [Lachnospiraceae bacterium]